MLAREDLTNQVEGRALQNKTTAAVCRFLIKDVICRYGCIGKIVADRGEWEAEEAEELFNRLGVKLSLTTAYNPEADGKVECGHGPIVKVLVRAWGSQVRIWPRLLPYALWADRTTHSSVTGPRPRWSRLVSPRTRCREENRPRGELEHKGVGTDSTHTHAPRST